MKKKNAMDAWVEAQRPEIDASAMTITELVERTGRSYSAVRRLVMSAKLKRVWKRRPDGRLVQAYTTSAAK